MGHDSYVGTAEEAALFLGRQERLGMAGEVDLPTADLHSSHPNSVHLSVAEGPGDLVSGRTHVLRASRFAPLLTSLPLLVADIAALTLSGLIAIALVHLLQWQFIAIASAPSMHWYEAFGLLPLMVAYFADGLYPGAGIHPVIEVRQVARMNAAAGFAVLAALAWHGSSPELYLAVTVAALMSIALVPTLRAFARAWACRRSWWGLPVIVCGSNIHLRRAVALLKSKPTTGFRPVCAVDASNTSGGHATGVPILRHPRGAVRLARRANIRHAVVVLPDLPREAVARIVERYARSIPNVLMVSLAPGLPSLFQDARECSSGLHGVEVRNQLLLTLPCLTKRVMDLTLVALSAPLWAPVMLTLAVLVRLTSSGPILFGHTRLGVNGGKFTAWKFRTMVPNSATVLREYLAANEEAREEWQRDHKLRHDPRVTVIGRFFRKTSLDELPQIWNVIKGEMSLVGPRPIVNEEIVKYGRKYNQYKQVKPGVTGLWQVSGRNNTTYGERVDLDRYYVQNWSPWLDLWILGRTIRTILRRDGAY